MADGELEIIGQRLKEMGQPHGQLETKIRQMGPAQNLDLEAQTPNIDHDPDPNHYPDVWAGTMMAPGATFLTRRWPLR